VIDYLQLMEGISDSSVDRDQAISDIGRGLKYLARELDISIIVCTQLARAAESRIHYVPALSELGEFDSIAQDADIVMFIHREEMYNPDTEKKGIAEIHIIKNRNGPLATIPLRFFSRTSKFADLELYWQA
jgi:replicative DNA helicase